MTLMYFVCPQCKHEKATSPNYWVGTTATCEECSAQFEVIKQLQAHICHSVPVFKDLKTGKLFTLEPVTFAVNPHNPSDVQEYFSLLSESE